MQALQRLQGGVRKARQGAPNKSNRDLQRTRQSSTHIDKHTKQSDLTGRRTRNSKDTPSKRARNPQGSGSKKRATHTKISREDMAERLTSKH